MSESSKIKKLESEAIHYRRLLSMNTNYINAHHVEELAKANNTLSKENETLKSLLKKLKYRALKVGDKVQMCGDHGIKATVVKCDDIYLTLKFENGDVSDWWHRTSFERIK